MLDSPQKYKARIIQTKAIVLGYHGFIFYSGECLDENKIIALEMSYEARHKMSEAIIDGRRNYKSNYLNGNLYAEITVLGELRENNEKQEEQVFRPKYKFFVTEIKNVSVLSEEILPVEKARGEKEIQK